jgi:hypothetical protein
MGNLIGDEKFDIEKFAKSLVSSGREAVKWENRKLEWILEEKRKESEAHSEAA